MHRISSVKEKLVVFRIDAGHARGLGHLQRMIVLSDKFEENGYDAFFLLRKNKIAESILEKRSKSYVSYPLEFAEKDMLKCYFDEYAVAGLWIFDILSTEAEWISYVKGMGVRAVVCFDDFNGGLKVADAVINPILGCWGQNSEKKGSRPLVFNGPSYAIIDPGVMNLKKYRKSRESIVKVGITMGGSDTYGATIKIAEALRELKANNLHIYFFLGPHFMHEPELNLALATYPHAYSVKKSVLNLHKELIEMDVVICGGGQTLFEVCALEIPALAFANEPHEEKTIDFFLKNNACINIGSIQKGVDKSVALQFFADLKIKQSGFPRRLANKRGIVDGNGAHRCYVAITGLLKELSKN